ncbi:MAG: hypothetical protein WC375_06145 [Methanomassiliicoccales archaeon]|jgi:hypothetical protein
MRYYKDDVVVVETLEKMVCDVCGKSLDPKVDCQQTQEFTFIEFVGGYSSVFGDGALVELDICQHCLKNLLGKYIRINDTTESEDKKIKAGRDHA